LDGPAISASLFLLLALVVTIAAVVRRRALLDDPAYWAFSGYVLFVGIGPLCVDFLNPHTAVMRQSFDPGTPVLVLSWAGLAALVCGYYAGKRRERHSQGVSSLARKAHDDDLTALLFGGLAWTLIGIVGTAAYLSKVGGLGYFLETPYGTREDASIYAIFYAMFQPGLFLILAWALTGKVRSRLVWAGLLIYLCFDLLWFGPIRGGRNEVVTLVLTFAYILKHIPEREGTTVAKPARRWGLLIASAVFVLVWGGIRSNPVEDIVSGASGSLDLASSAQENVATSLYATYQGFVGIVNSVPNLVPYQWGSTLLDSLTLFIPRAIWSDKPETASSWLARVFYGQRVLANISTTWPGELYLNFGWAGLVLGMFCTGIVCARIPRHRPMDRAGTPSVWQGLMGAVWLPFPFLLIWSGSHRGMWHIFTNVALVWIVGKAALLSPVRRQLARAGA